MNVKYEKRNNNVQFLDLAPAECFCLNTESGVFMKLQRAEKSLVNLDKDEKFNVVNIRTGVLRCIDDATVVKKINTDLVIYVDEY